MKYKSSFENQFSLFNFRTRLASLTDRCSDQPIDKLKGRNKEHEPCLFSYSGERNFE